MIRRLTRTLGAPTLGIAVLLTVFTIPPAFGGDLIVKGNIPFAFQVAGKTLPAGDYELQFENDRESVTIISATPKGPGALAIILAFLAPPAHSSV